MAPNIDRRKVQGSFHRQASEYDRYAVVQARVVQRMVEQLGSERVHPDLLLDVGAGTGRLLVALRELFPNTRMVGADLALGMCRAASETLGGAVPLVNADAEKLPFAEGVFDLVLSTSTFQWLTTLEQAFAEAKRVLAPGGLFLFALFGERTLFELRESYRTVLKGGEDRTHSFFTVDEVMLALRQAGFAEPRVHAELEVEFHPDVPELLRSLKRIGAGSTAPPAATGLSERRVMLDMMAAYQKSFGGAAGIPATYEVIYGVGVKS